MSFVRVQAPVIVFATLIVAALVNRNDTVAVIDASGYTQPRLLERIVAMLTK